MIAGFATEDGTAGCRDRMAGATAASHFRRAHGLWWSSIGFGTYLGGMDAATDNLVADAVVEAVGGGVNVVDSAANYRSERGERSVGRALARLIGSGAARREEIIVCTKGGYVPHGSDRFLADHVRPGGAISRSDLVGGHCMHPEYLSRQLDQSRRNLGIDTIDLYYLHNPESQAGAVDAATFDARVEAAFRMFDKAVAENRVRAYGIASWNAFRLAPGTPKHMALSHAKNLARRAAGGAPDHFRFVQMPLNLGMTEALKTPTQRIGDRSMTAVQAALTLGLGVVASGSIGQGKFAALPADAQKALGPDLSSDAQRALQFTRSAPGVTTALIGMKQPRHVGEALALCAEPPLDAGIYRGLLGLA